MSSIEHDQEFEPSGEPDEEPEFETDPAVPEWNAQASYEWNQERADLEKVLLDASSGTLNTPCEEDEEYEAGLPNRLPLTPLSGRAPSGPEYLRAGLESGLDLKSCSAGLAEAFEQVYLLLQAAGRARTEQEAVCLAAAAPPLALQLAPDLSARLFNYLPALCVGMGATVRRLRISQKGRRPQSEAQQRYLHLPVALHRTVARLAQAAAQGQAPGLEQAAYLLEREVERALSESGPRQTAPGRQKPSKAARLPGVEAVIRKNGMRNGNRRPHRQDGSRRSGRSLSDTDYPYSNEAGV